ncbi:hypothetical protein BGX28_001348 [Mortierella sp. GBA30]|nr:hypothetical protein BGX28_001348 [Mortierella sp. GBA30]
MFSSHSAAAAAVTGAGAGDSNTWFHDNDILLSPQDSVNYTSFSSEVHLPILPFQSFSSTQPSASMSSFFPEFAPLPSTTAGIFHDMPSFPSTVTALPLKDPVSNSDTARQAVLLHAYLTAQNQPCNTDQQWTFPTATLSNEQIQHMHLMEQRQQQEDQGKKDQEEKRKAQQVELQIQQADALNLARYLAQSEQIKNEASSETAMEHDAVSAPHSPSPSSSSSESGDKSPMTSPFLAERSLSPEASAPGSAKTAKVSRQLICFNCKVTQTPLWRRTPDRKHSLCNACGLYYKQYGAHRPLHVRHKLPAILADVRLSALPYARPSAQQSSRGPSPNPTSPSEVPFSFASIPMESSISSSDSDSDSSRGLATSLPDLAKMYSEALIRPPAQKTSPPLMTAKLGIKCANCSQTQTPLWRKNDAGEPICNACGLYAKLHNRDRPVTMRKSKISRRRRDWGGNLAHQAQAQAQALALAHAQAQAAVMNGQLSKGGVTDQHHSSLEVASIVEEMNLKAQELVGRSASVVSSDSEEEHTQFQSMEEHQQQQRQVGNSEAPTPAPLTAAVPVLGQSMSSNLIMDENKFSDMIGQMNAHQMNRFLSILETRCGVLRKRLLASTETKVQDNFDHLF